MGNQFLKYIVFLSLKIDLILANSADHDEMPHHAAFHLGIRCLQNYPFTGLRAERADLLALVCGVFCEFVTFPLVSWVRCGT